MLRYPPHADMHLTTYKYPNSSNTSWGSEWGPGTRDNWPNSRKEQGPLHMGSGPLSIMIWYISYFEHNVRNFKSIYAKSFVFWQEKETEQYFCKMWKTFEGPFKVYWVGGRARTITRSSKGPPKIYGKPGPGFQTGGLGLFLSGEKGGHTLFLTTKKGGPGIFFTEKKWGPLLFFPSEKGGSKFFSQP